MSWSWRIGRIAGIDVFVHFTFLLLVAWVGLSYYLAHGDPMEGLYGVVFILALFGIVVLHELGHALAARGYGIPTRDITLLPIGGVSRLERMPDDPRQELIVALAGPAVNVVLAAGLYVGLCSREGTHADRRRDARRRRPSGPALLGERVAGGVQPAAGVPDGRRPGAGALLALRLDYVRATQIAAWVGQGLAVLFGLVGLFYNPLLLLIALFVWLGASQEASMAQMCAALDGIPVMHTMITDFRILRPDDPLARAVEHVRAGFQQDFPVVEGDRLVGVLHAPRPDGRSGAARPRGPRRRRHAARVRDRRSAGHVADGPGPAPGLWLSHALCGAGRPSAGPGDGG